MSRFVSRSLFISELRAYLCSAGYIEVETPILQEQATGATASTFNTYHNEMNQDMQLRIALEIHLKLCIMGGLDRVFEIGRVFRNEGVSSRHNPEFTLLEMYAAWTDLEHMMSESEQIVRMAYAAFGRELPEFRVATMSELVGDSNDVIGDFDNRVASTLIEPTFVTNHPLSDSPFAQEDTAHPGTAMRFELYINGVEVANAYREINDAEEQALRLRQADGSLAPMDAYFVNAMRNGMPPTSGLGVGIDRLVMLASGASSIRDIVLFPSMRNSGGTTML
jgi:lysyl-tRNA synthetase class 2